MQEFDIIRLLIYVTSLMISIVTFLKHVRIEGIIGSTTKMISAGAFFIISSLLFQTILSLMNNENIIMEVLVIFGVILGIGLVFFGLWKTSIFFDQLHHQAEKQVITTQKLDTEQK